MSCRRFRKSLIEYVDGDLAAERADKVRAHLETCESCKAASEKLEFSRSALASLAPVKMPDASAARIAAALRSSGQEARPALHTLTSRLSYFSSTRGLAAAGVAAALILGLVIVVVSFSGTGRVTNPDLTKGTTAEGPLSQQASTSPGQQKVDQGLLPSGIASILPTVKVSNNDYDETGLRNTFDKMEVKKEIADTYTMGHAINYCDLYKRKMADMMVDCGDDGAMLEAMISYITQSEPVLLPYYAESAKFTGLHVFIIGLAGPRRTDTSAKLTRTEVWVMNPAKFQANPDSSIVYFLEQK